MTSAYLLLDSDVPDAERAEIAARVGFDCMVCAMPEGCDPDDLGPKALQEARDEAVAAIDAWAAIVAQDDAPPDRAGMRRLSEHVTAWRASAAHAAGYIRTRLCDALGMTGAEYHAWITAGTPKAKRQPGKITPDLYRSADPLGPPPAGGAARPDLPNFTFFTKYTPDKNGAAATAPVDADVRKELKRLKTLARQASRSDDEQVEMDALVRKYNAKPGIGFRCRDIAEIRDDVLDSMKGFPHRLRIPGALKPQLFVDRDTDDVAHIVDAKDFQAMLSAYVRLKFHTGQDEEWANFTSTESLYKHFGHSERVQEWYAVENAPHWPPFERHYYNWRPPEGYEADGERFAEFLGFFDNVAGAEGRALLAASVATLFWGGPLGQRPAFVFEAHEHGCGKTRAATLAARLVNDAGGVLAINMDRRSEERLKERMLSPDGQGKRVGLVDNARATVSNALLEELVTCEWISGKRLAVGEATRPNTIVYFITSNNVRLSPDMASRAFFVQFLPIDKGGEERAAWSRRVEDFMAAHGQEVVADILAILSAERLEFDWGTCPGERFAPWVEEVLGAVMASEAVMGVVGEATPQAVLAHNNERRGEADDDMEEAELFMAGLLERVVAWKGYTVGSSVEEVFIRTQAPPPKVRSGGFGEEDEDDDDEARNNMLEYWKAIFSRRDISAKWLVRNLKAHVDSGRIKGLVERRRMDCRGWVLHGEVVAEYLRRIQAEANERAMADSEGAQA